MELRHLRYFVVVAEEQNVTRAATRLHVSQPPLSRQIRDLEDELGVALFERSAKSVRLTEAGRVFLEEARAVLKRAHDAVQTVKAVSTGQQGELHVGYAPSLTVELLPKLLRAFQEETPGIRVHLHDLSTEEMLKCLHNDTLHVVLMIRPTAQSLSGMQFIELQRYKVCVAAHPAHPCARGSKVSLADLSQERLIAYSRKDYPEYHELLAALFKKTGKVPRIAEEHDSSTSLIAAVEAGRGIAIVPESMTCLVGERLKLRPISPAPAPLHVGLAARSKGISVAAQKFLTMAQKISRK